MAPTTVRLSADLTPGLVGGLTCRGPQASAVAATLLDLSARNAKAYRKGLEDTAEDDGVVMDLDAVLADAVAMNLGT